MSSQKQNPETAVKKTDGILSSLKNLILFTVVAPATILMIIAFKYLMLPYITVKLGYLGMTGNLAYALALPLFVLSAVITLHIFSPNPQNRSVGIVAGTIVWSLYFGFAYYIQRDKNYDFTTGKTTMCYAETPSGYERLSCEWKRHPEFGTLVMPITRDIINSGEVQKTGYLPVNVIAPKCNWSYFSPDGQPLAWYYRHEDGKIDLFNRPGNHPQLNIKLNPITREIVEEICRADQQAKDEQIKAQQQNEQDQPRLLETKIVEQEKIIAELQQQTVQLSAVNTQLKDSLPNTESLQAKQAQLQSQIEVLQQENAELHHKNSELQKQVVQLQEEQRSRRSGTMYGCSNEECEHPPGNENRSYSPPSNQPSHGGQPGISGG